MARSMPLVTTIARAWPPILFERDDLLVEVVDHDLGLEPDGMVMALDVAAQLLLRSLGVKLRVALDRLDQLVIAVDRRVVLQHVQDEALLDGLLHRVAVKGPVLDLAALGVWLAENLQRLVLGRGGEGEIAGIGQELARLHDAVDLVFRRLVLLLGAASESAMLIAADVRPPWLECASSMMMANLRPRCSLPISSRMNGNFCTVVMMIFLPLSMNLRRSPECSAWPTVAPTWANCLIVSRICLIQDAAVGDDDDRVED